MSLVVAQNISLSFGDRTIFDHLSFRIASDEKIGLIGPNGSGKSTLLRILSGEMGFEGGEIQYSRGCQIGYLPQDILELKDNVLLQSILESVPGKKQLDEQLGLIISRLEAATDESEQMALANELAHVQNRLDYYDLHYSEHEALKILSGLGFTQQDLHREINEFSGGWKMRIALAAILFRKPDLILLDEPTNHLDVPSVIWFDEFLQQYTGAIVLVSHDRFFLNRQISRIISFEPEGIRFYTGNYDLYCQLRKQEEELLEARARNIDKERKDLERFVVRFKAKASKARQAQSRVKKIARLEENAPKPIQVRRSVRFSFAEAERCGHEVVTIDNLVKAFGEHVIFNRLSIKTFRGDRIAVIGKNGIGKTTLLKMIAGELVPDGGSVRFGNNVVVRYYAQHLTEVLNQNNSLLQEMITCAPHETQTRIRSILGAFLFQGDDVEKPVKVLSGGEKARLSLAKLILQPGNLLLMDEPTNHLDIQSSEMLAEALSDFSGTILFVSHNRSFINHLATRVWDLQPTGLYDYQGNLEEYLDHLKLLQTPRTTDIQNSNAFAKLDRNLFSLQIRPDETTAPQKKPGPDTGSKSTKQDWLEEKKQKRESDVFRKNAQKSLKSLGRKMEQTEIAIAELEAQLKMTEGQLAMPTLYQNEQLFNELLNSYGSNKEKLDQHYKNWELYSAEIDHLKEQLTRLEDFSADEAGPV